jgi:hypothetical protein
MLAMFKPNGNANCDDLQTIEAAENAERDGRRQLWERQVGESTKAYSAFQKYLNLSSRRTLREVAELSHCSGQNIARWSRRWFWVARVQAYDVIEEEKFREQAARDRLAMRRRQIQLGVACQSVAAHGVRELQAKVASGQALNLGAEEIKSLLAIGSQLEGRGMGEEKDAKFTKIVVNFGGHQYPGEHCACRCTACISGCTGSPGEDGKTIPALEAAGYDDPDPKVN